MMHGSMNVTFPISVAWDKVSVEEVEKYRYSHYWPCSDGSVIFNIDIRTTGHVLTVL